MITMTNLALTIRVSPLVEISRVNIHLGTLWGLSNEVLYDLIPQVVLELQAVILLIFNGSLRNLDDRYKK